MAANEEEEEAVGRTHGRFLAVSELGLQFVKREGQRHSGRRPEHKFIMFWVLASALLASQHDNIAYNNISALSSPSTGQQIGH